MKILNVVTHMDPVTGGGCTERTRLMSRYLAGSGAEVTLLTTDVGLAKAGGIEIPGVEVVTLPSLINRFYVPVLQFDRIKKLVAAADMVHLMGHWSVLNGLVYRFLRRLGKPYVVCPAGALPIIGRSRVLKILYNAIIGQKIIKNAAAVILVTASELPQCEAYGIDREKVWVIPNGIEPVEAGSLDITGFREKSGLGQTPFILFLGRLNQVKGPDLLLQAFCEILEELAPYHLALAGPDGGMRAGLEETVARYGAGARVHFLGYLDNRVKMQACRAAALVAIPSRQEAMSIVVLEAGSVGTPVLITDQCGFDEVAAVEGGEVVPATVAGLKAGLLKMLQDPARLAAQGANLGEFVRSQFRWEAMVTKYSGLYRRILGSSPAP